MISAFLFLAACRGDCPPGQGWADGACHDLLDTGGLETRDVCPELERVVPGEPLPDEFEACIEPRESGICPLRSELDDRDVLEELPYEDTGGCSTYLSIWCGPVTKSGECCYSVDAICSDSSGT